MPGANDAFKKRLQQLSRGGVWEKAQADASTPFATIPDGKYLVLIVGAKITEAQSDGHLQIKWDYRVEEGEEKNVVVSEYMDISQPERLKWLFIRCTRLGIDLGASGGPEALPQVLEHIENQKYYVRLSAATNESKKNPGQFFQNYNVDRVFGYGDDFDPSTLGMAGETDE